jgi:hypothetical protein
LKWRYPRNARIATTTKEELETVLLIGHAHPGKPHCCSLDTTLFDKNVGKMLTPSRPTPVIAPYFTRLLDKEEEGFGASILLLSFPSTAASSFATNEVM